MRVERELVAILHYAREDINVYSVNGNIPKRLRGRQCERLTLTRQLSRAESWVILPMLHPHGRWRLGDGPWQEGQGGIVDETQRQIDVTMHVVARHGRVVVLDTSDPRVGFELDDEDQVLELVEADEASLVVLEGKGAFLDEGLPVLTPVNTHRPLTWRRIRREKAALVAAQSVDGRGRYVIDLLGADRGVFPPSEARSEIASLLHLDEDAGWDFILDRIRAAMTPMVAFSADSLSTEDLERLKEDVLRAMERPGRIESFSIQGPTLPHAPKTAAGAAMTLTERAKSMLTAALPSIADTLPELMQPAELEAWNTHITAGGTLRIQVGWDEADGAPIWVDFARLPTPVLNQTHETTDINLIIDQADDGNTLVEIEVDGKSVEMADVGSPRRTKDGFLALTIAGVLPTPEQRD